MILLEVAERDEGRGIAMSGRAAHAQLVREVRDAHHRLLGAEAVQDREPGTQRRGEAPVALDPCPLASSAISAIRRIRVLAHWHCVLLKTILRRPDRAGMGWQSRETRPGHPAWRPGRGGAPLEREASTLAIPTMRREGRVIAPGWEATTRELKL